MQHLRITLFVILLAAPLAVPVRAQSTSVDVDITLVGPAPTCSFTLQSSLDFGTAEKPTSGTGSVTISATSATRTVSGTSASGSSDVGQVRLDGSNVSSYSVSRTFPGTLTRSGGSLGFSGSWAHSTTSGSGYLSVSSSSYSGTAGGAGSTFRRYFRFGGTVSGIGLSDPDGSYSGTISTSATCS